MLKRIELIGFKSFAKKGVLAFEHPITAIVGPNGSGKSNTAEAFRFVLGEQGSKVLRVKKGTDLIWAGSHTLPGASRAGVKVVLDNKAGQLKVDFNEVIVERTVLKDGTNEYTINGSKVRLKDIQELLAGAHIGSSGHHIISQGEADRILGASSKERREMLEDALGLKSYILKQQEAQRKLEKTRENIREVELKRREIAPHLKFLERQVARVNERDTLREEVRQLAKVYINTEAQWLAQEQAAIIAALPTAQKELTAHEDALVTLQKKLADAKESAHDASAAEAHAAAGRVVQQSRQKASELRQKLGAVEGQLKLLSSLKQESARAPASVPRGEVERMLTSVREELDMVDETKDAATIGAIVVRARRVVVECLKGLQAAPKQADATEYAARTRALQKEVATHTAALQKALQEVATLEQQEQQLAVTHATHDAGTLTIERDIFKVKAERSAAAAQVHELEQRKVVYDRRRALWEENKAEVQVLLAQEVGSQEVAELPSAEEMEAQRKALERSKVRLESYANLGDEARDEYEEVKKRHDFLAQETADLTNAEEKLTELTVELEERMQRTFSAGLVQVGKAFSEFFAALFNGGSAELVEEQVSEGEDGELKQAGIEVKVQLPRKKVTSLDTLSGGERALASIALIFAMSQVNPPPFIILDETDAALDEANSRRYAEMVKKLSERSQLILVTHNRATMAAADKLYGVTMGNDGVSQLLSVTLTDATQFAK